jgi:diphthamide synthase (EF-2-diphthine--ammonia ligase)
LASEVIAMGFKAYLSCVEPKVGPGFVGRRYDAALLRDLPAGIDPCGEYGEFHSFVFDGPIFKWPVAVRVGEIVVRDGRHYADLLPEELAPLETCIAEKIPPV